MADKNDKPTWAKPLQELVERVGQLQKEVAQLRDILNVQDNWHAEVRQMIGKAVKLTDMTGHITIGTLQWSDRYNLCIVPASGKRQILMKGGLVSIELA